MREFVLYKVEIVGMFIVQVPKQEYVLEFTAPHASIALGLVSPDVGQESQEILQHLNRIHELVKSGIRAGYEQAVSAGPLCMEPMWGVAFQVETKLYCPVRNNAEEETCLELGEDVYGPFSGQVL